MMQVICRNDAKKGYTLRYPLQDNSNDTGKERVSRYQIVKKYKAKTVKLTVTLGCVAVLSPQALAGAEWQMRKAKLNPKAR